MHLIPDALELLGIAYPLVATNTTASGASALMDSGFSPATRVELGAEQTYQNFVGGSWKMSALYVIGGLGLKWLGKKTGLNRVGTKEVKLL